MKSIGKIGFALSALTLAFALYVMFIVAPASDQAEMERERISNSIMMSDLAEGQTYFDVPGYAEAFEASEKKVDYAGYALFGSILPFLLCLIAVFKKDRIALIGLVLSLAAFFIGAAYGTHMFS